MHFKKISKFVARSSESRNDKHPLVVSVYDEISANENIHLYEELLTKHKSSIYSKRMASQIKTLEEGKTFFENLSLEKQVFTLFEIMRIFQCKIIGADLSKIGGSKSAGVIYLSNDITKAKQAKLINQSPTGLFESEIDLLKI